MWGTDADPRTLAHSAVIVVEQDCLDRLWRAIPQTSGTAEWTIIAQGAAATGSGSTPGLSFGSRHAFLAEAALLPIAREACWIESFEHGWLFLIAGADSTGLLIAVGARPEDLLKSSRSLAHQVSSIREVQAEVPAYPRITSPLFGDGWLACGTAAMMLDPLCGDGSGHAVREAILATAVLRGGATPDLLEHYQARLRLAFERHLTLCRSYYVSGCSGPWWEREIALLDEGLEWTRAHAIAKWRYRLDELDLVPLS